MKCLNCGFRNLPDAKVCGACGADLAMPTASASFYPPRAWGRRFRQPHPEMEMARDRWWRRLPFRRPDTTPTETLHQKAEQRRLRWLMFRTALQSLWGIIPGLGLLRERRTAEGWRLLAASFICLAIAALCWFNSLSNIALLTIVGLSVYSVGATFFAAWQRNNLPALSPTQKFGIWSIIVSLFLWAYFLGIAALRPIGGTAVVPFTVNGDEVVQAGNRLLYSHLPHHLSDLKPGDYVLVDTSDARTLEQVGFWHYGGIVIRFGAITVGRLETIRKSAVGTDLQVAIPLLIGGQTAWERVILPADSVRGKIIAILNPPPRRRWLR